MLVITRRRKQNRVIVEHAGERLIVALVNVDRSAVRLGFEGPKSFRVMREEILDDGVGNPGGDDRLG